jgi:hypothetical protein
MRHQVLVRMPADLLARVEAFADEHPLIEGNIARAMRALVEAGLTEVGRKGGRR